MAKYQDRVSRRQMRHQRVRHKIVGTEDRPRLNVFQSHKNIYLQIIDDIHGKTLAAASTLEAELKNTMSVRGNVTAAKAAGSLVARRAIARGIQQVIFDRGGHAYQGAVKAMADAAREAGLKF